MAWCRRALGASLVTTALLGVSGCSLALAPAGQTTSASAGPGSAVTTPVVHHNEVTTPPGPEEHGVASPTPVTALRSFATTYVNWDAADVRARMLALAADSVGQARSALALTAQQTGADPELAQAGIANHGSVEAVAPLSGRGGRYVVVTLESTTATNSAAYTGIAPAWHLTLAAVARRPGGWVVSAWQPEN